MGLEVTNLLKMQNDARVEASDVLPNELGNLEAVLNSEAAASEDYVVPLFELKLNLAIADVAVEIDVPVGDADLPALVVRAAALAHLLTNGLYLAK